MRRTLTGVPAGERPDNQGADSGEFDTRVHWRQLPEEVKRNRWIANAERERVNTDLQPRIQGHLEVYGMALDGLSQAHAGIAETSPGTPAWQQFGSLRVDASVTRGPF